MESGNKITDGNLYSKLHNIYIYLKLHNVTHGFDKYHGYYIKIKQELTSEVKSGWHMNSVYLN